jgi:IclR family transcriptional regulator, KDG regulon repressor
MPATATILQRHAVRRPERDGGSSKSLQKALRILVYMGEQAPEAGVTQLASELGLTKATVHRLLKAMERFELIERNAESERYRLGLKLYQLGNKAVESRTLRSEARRLLMEMSRRSRESVSLAVPTPGGVTCLDRVDSPHTLIKVCTPVGAVFPPHCTAAGKAILAYMTDDEVYDIVKKNQNRRYTQFTITQFSDLKENLRLIRQRGYAVDHQELERGLSGVAAPVLSVHERVIAAVGIAGPTLRFRGKELEQKVSLVTEIAARLAMGLVRMEENLASVAFEKSPETNTLRASREEYKHVRTV